MDTVANLAKRQHRTVVFTIHQPRSNIFQLFDKLLLLAKGKVIYFGSTSHLYDYFIAIDRPIPLKVNAADYLCI